MFFARSFVLVLPLLLAACGSDREEKVFLNARSPDGEWTAQAVDEHHFGPGNAAHYIRVTLTGINLDHEDVLVVEPTDDADGYPGRPDKYISLAWQAPNRLTIAYHNATAQFIVSRIAGVDVVTQAS